MDFKKFDTLIDARTPAEYALDHIPGAVSAPVLDDAQRAEVGTLYKQVSPFEAKKRGGALVAQNVARHIETLFKGHEPSRHSRRTAVRCSAACRTSRSRRRNGSRASCSRNCTSSIARARSSSKASRRRSARSRYPRR